MKYLKYYFIIFGTCAMVSPLIFAFWALDHNYETAGWYTGIMYLVAFCLIVPMFNYLQEGKLWISK
jgi:hypothetical protein